MDGKTWTRYSISVWSDLRRSVAESRLDHPAAFPLELAARCIEIFTAAPGEVVLDPFAGTGTTLLAAYNLGRQGLGFEIYEHYLDLFERRLLSEEAAPPAGCSFKPRLYHDSAVNLGRYLEPNSVDFILTSPPYWDILLAKRSADRRRQRAYGGHKADLGRTGDYQSFLKGLSEVFNEAHAVLKPGCACVVVVMDLRKKNRFYPLHMDLSAALQPVGFRLEDIIVWDRRHEYNYLRPLGYPAVFRVNKVHEYLLIFTRH
ncbi:MAG TPA: site-specific DNA-methyltransferase [Bacillota bacterium]|nr:site-specific DNA-methyltransferase [Bacillota bacterium]HOA35668.1 site-specific DNA-methyltransferase [Bacillota bacterium]HOJ83538.1 site-specific DNA-methyltransferase [Bacillota bacterium]HOL15633.1 site-specific DNA-methyltransferase [Bacillota bacterium]HPZ11885.1 site-specific DNA-methyltransferase [Bacillota bacterium]